jgi:hypothetical protein
MNGPGSLAEPGPDPVEKGGLLEPRSITGIGSICSDILTGGDREVGRRARAETFSNHLNLLLGAHW